MRKAPLAAALVVGTLLAATLPSVDASGGTSSLGQQTTVPLVFQTTVGPLAALAKRPSSRRTASASRPVARAQDRRAYRIAGGRSAPPTRIQGSNAPSVATTVPVITGGAGLVRAWQGLNLFDQRYSDGGNQFSLEPPDQGLCVGGGRVFEVINDVLQVYSSKGKPLLYGHPDPTVKQQPVGLPLDQLLGLPPEFVRPDGPFTPRFPTDPSCLFDAQTHRWFVDTLVVGENRTTGNLTGDNWVYLAVSESSDPTGSWDVYRFGTADNGTAGTPDHHCPSRFCFGDFPQMGADANGIYITTNEYDLNDPATVYGIQVYAVSKRQLADGHADRVLMFQNVRPTASRGLLTLWPARSLPDSYDRSNGGVEYLIGNDLYAAYPDPGNHLITVALVNTSSLDAQAPDVRLEYSIVKTVPYSAPPLALQKPGPTPLLDCLNLGVKCFGEDVGTQKGPIPFAGGVPPQITGQVDSSFLSHGVLWTTAMTGLDGPGGAVLDPTTGAWHPIDRHIGVVYFAVRVRVTDGALATQVAKQGYVNVPGQNLEFPSLALNRHDRGYMGVTLVGPKYNPSAAYIPVGLRSEPDAVHIALAGMAPDDGFTGTQLGGYVPRWGDYGYAVPGPEDTIVTGSEYIASRCGFDEWLKDPTCGGSRAFLGNWATAIVVLRPS
jgi:hypothetical protein